MTKIYDVCTIESQYSTNDGKIKNKYRTVGTCLQYSDGKMSIKLDKFFNPLGALNAQQECWLSLFEQKSKEDKGANNMPNTLDNNNMQRSTLISDTIPF